MVGGEDEEAVVVDLEVATEEATGSREMATAGGMVAKGAMVAAREATEGAMATEEVMPAMAVAMAAVNRQAMEAATVATLRVALEVGMVSSKGDMGVEATVADP